MILYFADWKYVEITRFGKTYWRKHRIFVGWPEKTFSDCIGIDQQSTSHILGWTNYVSLIITHDIHSGRISSNYIIIFFKLIAWNATVETCFKFQRDFFSNRIWEFENKIDKQDKLR